MKLFVKVFLAVLVACLACATAASREHELEAQIMRLKSENTRLKSENMQLRSKHAVLPGSAELDASLVEDVKEAEEEAEGEEGRSHCYFKQADDNGKTECGGALMNWKIDSWGEKNAASASSEAKCLGRKTGHDKHCGTNSQWKFVPASGSEVPTGPPWCPGFAGSPIFLNPVTSTHGRLCEEVKDEATCVRAFSWPWNLLTTPKCRKDKDGKWQASTDASTECEGDPYKQHSLDGKFAKCEFNAAQGKCIPSKTITCGVNPWKDQRWGGSWVKLYVGDPDDVTNKIRPQVQEECERQATESGKDVEDVRKEYCNGNCLINDHHLNSKCEVSDRLWKSLNADLQYMGNGKEGETPRWRITLNTGMWKQALGYVSCPCQHGDNTKLSEEEALRRIAGQVSIIGIDPETRRERSRGSQWSPGARTAGARQTSFYYLRIGTRRSPLRPPRCSAAGRAFVPQAAVGTA